MNNINFLALAEPFPPEQISWRVGNTNSDKTRGMALAYIDARDVMRRLDEVVGPGNWQDDYIAIATRVICHLSIRVDGEWVRKTDGAGDTDFEPEKGGLSDAFKRAAVKWSIGRYLYDLDSPWVEIEPAGRSYRIKKAEEAKLQKLLPRPTADAHLSTSTDAPRNGSAVQEPAKETNPPPALCARVRVLLEATKRVEEKACVHIAKNDQVKTVEALTLAQAQELVALLEGGAEADAEQRAEIDDLAEKLNLGTEELSSYVGTVLNRRPKKGPLALSIKEARLVISQLNKQLQGA